MRKIKTRLEKYTQGKSKVFIIPSRAGLKYIFINFTLFLISLSYANNMSLLITFIMVSYLVLQMLETHKILVESEIKSVNIHDSFFNTEYSGNCHFKKGLSPSSSAFINIQFLDEDLNKIDTLKNTFQGELNSIFTLDITKRGHYKIKSVKLYTYASSKLFYVWRYFPLDLSFYIYPEKQFTKTAKHGVDHNKTTQSSEIEFSHHIPYVQGLSSKRIDWKVYARKDALYWKKHIDHQSVNFEINYQRFEGNKEERLMKMSYLIDKLFKEGKPWSLVLCHKTIKSSHSLAHYKKSLEAISEY